MQQNHGNLIKVNVGCGLTAPEGWVNIDSSWNAWLAQHPMLRWIAHLLQLLPEDQYQIAWPRNIVIHDVRKGLPFPDGHVQCIYASHFVEHLCYQEAVSFVKECFRVLANGGVLRIVVPDLQSLAESYLRERQMAPDSPAPADLFLEHLGLVPYCQPRGIRRLIAFLQDKNRHKWMYDSASIAALVHAAGFSVFRMCGWRESAIEGIAAVENKDRFVNAICVECTK